MGRHIDFVQLPVEAMEALVAGDLTEASRIVGVELTPFILDESWLWGIRADQLRRRPEEAEWVARVAVVNGTPVGHGGFHGPPDDRGMVEVAYSVDPQHQRQGHARAVLEEMVARVRSDPRVHVVRATISPDNTASLATIRPLGFHHVGEQWDEEDGRELIFELSV